MKAPSPPPLPAPPPPPPNPPMFGQDAPKMKGGQSPTGLPVPPSVLGLQTPTGGTGQKQLIGQ